MAELMQWQRSVVKKNGDIRKRFEQWGVPEEIRRNLGLHDGDKCTKGEFPHGFVRILERCFPWISVAKVGKSAAGRSRG